MKKLAIILHGYPKPVSESGRLVKLLVGCGYDVYCPLYMENSKEFSIGRVKSIINKFLKNRKPDLIIGLSLGGLLLPHIALDYPESKLIFIGTGARFNPKVPGLLLLVILLASPVGKIVGYVIQHLPEKLFSLGNGWINPVDNKVLDSYKRDAQKIHTSIQNADISSHISVLKFVLKVDNRQILKKLPNESLVIVGCDDVVMPMSLGLDLFRLLKNGKLLRTTGRHYAILDNKSDSNIRQFISCK